MTKLQHGFILLYTNRFVPFLKIRWKRSDAHTSSNAICPPSGGNGVLLQDRPQWDAIPWRYMSPKLEKWPINAFIWVWLWIQRRYRAIASMGQQQPANVCGLLWEIECGLPSPGWLWPTKCDFDWMQRATSFVKMCAVILWWPVQNVFYNVCVGNALRWICRCDNLPSPLMLRFHMRWRCGTGVLIVA